MLVIEQRGVAAAQPWTLSQDGEKIPGAERDERRAAIAQGLGRVGRVVPAVTGDAELDDTVGSVHTREYLDFLDGWSRRLREGELHVPHERTAPGVPQDTPLHAGVFDAAREGARTALTAAQAVASGQTAGYALCRPPGHHAGPDWSGGYCFINNAAVAVEALARSGRRPGVLDLDFHVGNGTAAILNGRRGRRYASVHATTARHYPWRQDIPGLSPELSADLVAPPTEAQYVDLVSTLASRLADEGVDTLVVSLGFDTVAGDPHGGWSLPPHGYAAVAAAAAGPGWPVCVVQEGGYHVPVLAECAESFARGLSGVADTPKPVPTQWR